MILIISSNKFKLKNAKDPRNIGVKSHRTVTNCVAKSKNSPLDVRANINIQCVVLVDSTTEVLRLILTNMYTRYELSRIN